MKVIESRPTAWREECPYAKPSIGLVVDVLYSDPDSWTLGIHQLQDACDLGHLELWMEYIPDQRERSSLASALGGMPITVHAPFVDMSIASRWDEHADASMRRLAQALDASIELGASAFTIHAGKFADFEDHVEVLKRVADRYHWLSERANGSIEIGIENLKAKRSGVSRESVSTLHDLQVICQFNPDLRLTPDVGHAVQNGEDPVELLYFAKDRIASVHLHDAAQGERSHRAFGNGDVPLDAVAKAILDVAPDYVTLELLSVEDGVSSFNALNNALESAFRRRKDLDAAAPEAA